MIVLLPPPALALAREIAEGRNNPKEAAGVVSRKWTPRYTDFEADFIGACGEVAGALTLRTEVDKTFFLHGDNGTDATAYGFRWQIKTSTYTGKDVDLKFNSAREFRADAALLVRSFSPERHEIIGIISRKRFLARAVRKDYRYGERLIVPASDLKPVDSLKGFVIPEIIEPKPAAAVGAIVQTNEEWIRDYERTERELIARDSPHPLGRRPSRGSSGAPRAPADRGGPEPSRPDTRPGP